LVVRPERIRIVDGGGAGDGLNVVEATVDEVLYLGPDTKYHLALGWGQRVAVREPRESSGRELQRGDQVRLAWSVDDGLLVADPGGA
jgi:putative spermidine/putrescine transport system ATP-binding protein